MRVCDIPDPHGSHILLDAGEDPILCPGVRYAETEEPPAELRELAVNMRGLYVAMRQANFTEREACRIIGTWFANTPGDD